MRNDRTNAALAGAVAIGFGVVTFVGDGGARQNIGSDVEQEFEVAAVAGFAPGQMEGSGKPSRSTLRWILVEKPPRERPSA